MSERDFEDQDLVEQCVEIIRTERRANICLLQRRLRLGYTSAARIMQELESRGIVGPYNGMADRSVLIEL